MKTFEVEQAIFASADRGSMRGYQLVARSPGIDNETAAELCRWAPTQWNPREPDQWIINAFPLGKDRTAVTRSVAGGPEYSARGGCQVATLMMVADHADFGAYGFDPMLLVRTAMALGWLRLPHKLPEESMPRISLPAKPLTRPPDPVRLQGDPEQRVLREVSEMLQQTKRVAIVGARDGVAVVEKLLPQLSPGQRRHLSFTTGLAPAVRRPFTVHCLDHADPVLRRTLQSQNIMPVHVGAPDSH